MIKRAILSQTVLKMDQFLIINVSCHAKENKLTTTKPFKNATLLMNKHYNDGAKDTTIAKSFELL